MDAKNGYCSGQLKQAKNLARDGYYDSSINAVGKGLERLLQDLYGELRDKDKRYLFALTDLYLEATKERRWSISKNGHRELNLYGWIKFYEKEDIFIKLEETCGYEFDEFNAKTLHKIRLDRNEFGSHENEQYDIHREISDPLIELYSKILSETGRIAQPSSIAPRNQIQTVDTQELRLHPNEKYELKQHYDRILRIDPNDLDVLFLRAYLSRGEQATQNDLDLILHLNPNHAEAQKEKKRDQRATHKNYKRPMTGGRLNAESNTVLVQILNIVYNKIDVSVNLSLPRFSKPELSIWDKAMLLIGVVVVTVVVALVIGVAALTPVLVVLFQGLRDFVAGLLALFGKYLGALTDGNIYALAMIALPLVALMFIVAVRRIFPRRRKTCWERIMDRIGL